MRQAIIVATAIGAAILAADANAQSQRLIDEGRRLFFEETFDGNGRTCGTCHPATNNFTIDPDFVENLPPNDPLFVDVPGLEDPDMLAQGLVLENVDGPDPAEPVFRGVPHTLGLQVSIEPDDDGDGDQVFADGTSPEHALGWSADGSPEDGSLRSFAIGAVRQHFTKDTERVEGRDFRRPTNAELDALEAFQLSLGRDEELDLAALTFLDEAAERGRALFEGMGTNRACTACHANAGANTEDGANDNFDTGTRTLTMPPDGGFGREDVDGIEGLGNGTMNTPSLAEVADTAPFFHNNSAPDLAAAIRFYTSGTFAESPSGAFGGAFQLNEEQIADVAAFLRAINAQDNAQNALQVAEDAKRMRDAADTIALMEAVIADIQDGIDVLEQSGLAPEAVEEFEDALDLAQSVGAQKNQGQRNKVINQVRKTLRRIPPLIAVENLAVASGR